MSKGKKPPDTPKPARQRGLRWRRLCSDLRSLPHLPTGVTSAKCAPTSCARTGILPAPFAPPHGQAASRPRQETGSSHSLEGDPGPSFATVKPPPPASGVSSQKAPGFPTRQHADPHAPGNACSKPPANPRWVLRAVVSSLRGSDGPNPTGASPSASPDEVSPSVRHCIPSCVGHTVGHPVPLSPKLRGKRNWNDPCFWMTEPRLTTPTCGVALEQKRPHARKASREPGGKREGQGHGESCPRQRHCACHTGQPAHLAGEATVSAGPRLSHPGGPDTSTY